MYIGTKLCSATLNRVAKWTIFVWKQGQGLKACAAHLCQNFRAFCIFPKISHLPWTATTKSYCICNTVYVYVNVPSVYVILYMYMLMYPLYMLQRAATSNEICCAPLCYCSCIMTPRNLLFVLFIRYYCLNLPQNVNNVKANWCFELRRKVEHVTENCFLDGFCWQVMAT